MESLFKKLDELSSLLKKFGTAIKPPNPVKTPSIPKTPTTSPAVTAPKMPGITPKMPSIAPSSKKDPSKVAQQLKNPRPMKPKTGGVKVSKLGQWSMN